MRMRDTTTKEEKEVKYSKTNFQSKLKKNPVKNDRQDGDRGTRKQNKLDRETFFFLVKQEYITY